MRLSLLCNSSRVLSQLSGLLIMLVIFGCLPYVGCQCCQKFLNGMCISCPPDTRLVLGNCLLNKPNCFAYNVFQCTKCNMGYALDANNLCVPLPSEDIRTGYFYLNQAEINSNFIQTLVKEIRNKLSSKLDGLALITVLAANVNQEENLDFPLAYKYYFRFIFSAEKGFVEYNYEYTPNNNTFYTSINSVPAISDFVQKKVKIITLNDENNSNEGFIDFRADPYSDQILKQLEAKEIKTKTTRFLDVFRSFSPAFEKIPAIYNYRIFLVSPNQGLFFVTKIIQIQAVDIINLDPLILSVLEQIKMMNNWSISLNNTQLISLNVLNSSNGISNLNVTYRHLGIIDPQTKNMARSWYVFMWQQLPNNIKVDVLTSSIYTQKPSIPTTAIVKSLVTKPTITPIAPQRPAAPKRKTPSWQPIPNNINLQQYISLLQFFKLKDFSTILTYLNTNFVKYTVGQDIFRAAVGENGTYKIYEVQFRVYSLELTIAQYVFTLNKDKNQMDIVQFMLTNATNRTDVLVDSRNRQSVINGFDAVTNQMIKNIVLVDPLYNEAAELFQYSTFLYKTSQTSNRTKRLSLKYYFPAQTNKTYEFIEYRSEIKDNDNPTTNTKLQKINTIIFPKQVYELVDETDNLTRDTVIFAVEQLLMEDLMNTSYNVLRVFKSLDRIGYFRVQIDYVGGYLVLYQFDSNSNTYIRSITNKTSTISLKNVRRSLTNNDASTSKTQSNRLATSSSPKQPIPPKAYNPLYFFQYFPTKTTKPTTIPLKQIDTTYLTQNELKIHISNFFNITPKSIGNVTILNLETLDDIIDDYYVEFTQVSTSRINLKTVKNTYNYRFHFQIDRKNKRNPTNIAMAARNTDSQSSLRKSSDGFGLSWILAPVTDLFNKVLRPVTTIPSTTNTNKTPITIPYEQSQNKPASILEQILNRPVKITNNKQLSNTKQKAMDDFKQNIPNIIPISYQQNINFKIVPAVELNKPAKPTPDIINYANKDLVHSNIYTANLASVQVVRQKKVDSGLDLVSILHVYFGNVLAWCSVNDYKLYRVDYLDGFHIKSKGISIIKQVPQLTNVHQLISDKISQTLNYFGYQQNKSPKTPKQTDIIYWKYKKLPTLNQVQLYYQFNTFLIKADIIMNQQQKIVTEYVIINNNKKGNQKLADLRKVLYSNYFMKANYQLYFQYGYYFQDADIVYVNQEADGQNLKYFVVFLGPQGFITVNLVFNIPTLKTTIQNISQADQITPPQLLQGCQTLSKTPLQCKQCSSKYYLHKNDKICYLKIQNCSFQSRQICLECQIGFFLTADDRCQ